MALDKAFSHSCTKTTKFGNISATKFQETKTGFQNWKKALEKNSGLAKHNDSIRRFNEGIGLCQK